MRNLPVKEPTLTGATMRSIISGGKMPRLFCCCGCRGPDEGSGLPLIMDDLEIFHPTFLFLSGECMCLRETRVRE